MATRILGNEDYAALYDSVTMTAFGPVLGGDDKHVLDATEVADVFLSWLGRDPRGMEESDLASGLSKFYGWLDAQEERWDDDDLKHLAKCECLCDGCGEWLDGGQFDPGREICRACVSECARDMVADAKGSE